MQNNESKIKNEFEDIIPVITKTGNKSAVNCNIVYSELEKKVRNGDFNDYPFLKFFNIWNEADITDKFKVAFYADFIHTEDECVAAGKEKFTNSKDKVFIGDAINDFWGNKLEPVYNKGKLLNDAFEVFFYGNFNKDDFSQDYYHNSAVDKDRKITHGFVMKNIFSQNLISQSDMERWLMDINNSYFQDNKTTQTITHFYFFISPCYLGEIEENYRVKTNIGVDFSSVINDKEGRRIIRNFINQLKNFINDITMLIVYSLKEDELRKVAVRAAISQVMTRNLSHNIGSHVFVNLIGSKIYSELKDKINKSNYSPQKKKDKEGKDTAEYVNPQDCDNQLAYFNQYLKSRMDYLSEVTFGVSNILTTKRIYNDVMLEFDRVRLLLNHISGINDFNYQFELKYNGSKLSKDSDISAAFPSDILGCQAFYNIIENIIRNTAKHAKTEAGLKTVAINIKDIPSDATNLPNDYQQYYCVEIDDNISVPDIDSLVKRQNERLDCSVLNDKSALDDSENHKLRNNSLGLLEMEASACFLRQIDMPEMESTDYDIDVESPNDKYANTKGKLNIVKAFKAENNALGYRFFIKKPQEFLFIGDWKIGPEKEAELMNHGIGFKSEKELIDDLKKGVAFAHRFVIATKTEDDFYTGEISDKKYSYKTLLPNRWIKVDTTDDISGLLNNEFDILNLEAKIWEIYNRKNGVDISKTTFKSTLQEEVSLTDYEIVLLNHFNEQEEQVKQFTKKKASDFYKKNWIEPLSSDAKKKLPYIAPDLVITDYVENVNNDPNCKFDREEKSLIAKSMLWDSYNTTVLVVDERIKEYSELISKGAASVTNNDCFANAGVIITAEKLSTRVLDDNLLKNISSEIAKYKPTFLLIHYGILERAFHNNAEKIKYLLKDWTENRSCKVVVTSGRGKHSLELPDYVRYLNLSSVLYAFVENQNKYSITYILNQARR